VGIFTLTNGVTDGKSESTFSHMKKRLRTTVSADPGFLQRNAGTCLNRHTVDEPDAFSRVNACE
jgi:hypothetical protein